MCSSMMEGQIACTAAMETTFWMAGETPTSWTGGSGNDHLVGGTGADLMDGGGVDDQLVLMRAADLSWPAVEWIMHSARMGRAAGVERPDTKG
jgi:Ca2+-binding RTX toxin-like protein